MAVRLVFESSDGDYTSKLECSFLDKGIFLEIYPDDPDEGDGEYIFLNKQDAIKLVKVLKTEINKMGVSKWEKDLTSLNHTLMYTMN